MPFWLPQLSIVGRWYVPIAIRELFSWTWDIRIFPKLQFQSSFRSQSCMLISVYIHLVLFESFNLISTQETSLVDRMTMFALKTSMAHFRINLKIFRGN